VLLLTETVATEVLLDTALIVPVPPETAMIAPLLPMTVLLRVSAVAAKLKAGTIDRSMKAVTMILIMRFLMIIPFHETCVLKDTL
jgi:hypothetical protein